jgi:hypothetical protein
MRNAHAPEALTLLAEAYQRSDNVNEARLITSRLAAAGYRHPDFLALLETFPDLKTPAVASAQ